MMWCSGLSLWEIILMEWTPKPQRLRLALEGRGRSEITVATSGWVGGGKKRRPFLYPRLSCGRGIFSCQSVQGTRAVPWLWLNGFRSLSSWPPCALVGTVSSPALRWGTASSFPKHACLCWLILRLRSNCCAGVLLPSLWSRVFMSRFQREKKCSVQLRPNLRLLILETKHS